MPLDLTDVDAFTDPVTVPEDGDDRDAASVLNAFQALADRTRNHKNRIDTIMTGDPTLEGNVTLEQSLALEGTAEILYSPARSRRDYVLPPVNADWVQFPSSDAQSRCTTASKSVAVRLPVPRGCTLTYVLVQVSSSGLGGNVSISLTRITPDNTFGASGPPTNAFIASANNGGASGYSGIQIGSISPVADSNSFIYLQITSSSGADGSNPDTIHSIAYDYSDLGPRNG